MSYVIKAKPEDFVVKEVSSFELHDSGSHTCFWLTKKNFSTQRALMFIATKWNVSPKQFSYAGLKDKDAVTTQLISIQGNFKDQLTTLDIPDISVSFAGFSNRPLSLGLLKGNKFEIVVRDIDTLPDVYDGVFYNFFGEQRFSENNVEIGRLFLQRKFKQAYELLKTKHDLASDQHGPLNALQKLPKKLLSLYVHSYQSHLFNTTLKNMIETGLDVPEELPLVGFGTTTMPPFMKGLLKEDGLKSRSFILREFHNVSSEGTVRKTKVKASDVTCSELKDDDLHPGKKKIKICFTLDRGCYATEFIRQKLT